MDPASNSACNMWKFLYPFFFLEVSKISHNYKADYIWKSNPDKSEYILVITFKDHFNDYIAYYVYHVCAYIDSIVLMVMEVVFESQAFS